MEIGKDKSNKNEDLFCLQRVHPAFWLTVAPGALVGFFLAHEKFAGGFDAVAFAICAAVLIAILTAYAISLRRFRPGRVVCTTGGWSILVLLGAAAGGGLGEWKIVAAAVVLGAYCGAVEALTLRAESTRKFGEVVKWAFSVISVTVCVGLTAVSFFTHGLAAISPWVLVWITLWVSCRSIYCSVVLRGRVEPQIARQLSVQLQRGVLLLQAGIMIGLLRNQLAAVGFIVAAVLLSVCNFLDKRSR